MSEQPSGGEAKTGQGKAPSIFDLRQIQDVLTRGEIGLPEALLVMTYMNVMDQQKKPQTDVNAILSNLGSQREKLSIPEALVVSSFLQQQGRPQVDVAKAVEDAVSKVKA